MFTLLRIQLHDIRRIIKFLIFVYIIPYCFAIGFYFFFFFLYHYNIIQYIYRKEYYISQRKNLKYIILNF